VILEILKFACFLSTKQKPFNACECLNRLFCVNFYWLSFSFNTPCLDKFWYKW